MFNILKRKDLSQIEFDFIDFISEKRNSKKSYIKDIFVKTKAKFKFAGIEYRNLCTDVHDLFQIVYDDKEEKNLYESYRFHSLMHLYRWMSYAYDNLGFFKTVAKYLQSQLKESPKVVDYGCGLAHISFEIGKSNKKSIFYLVDIDCLVLEFVEYRFKKHNIDCKVIPVNIKNPYPKLPVHNIVIANEVMEHLVNPLEAYSNIVSSLESKGLLIGYFEDHQDEMFHISTDLFSLREKLDQDFRLIKQYKDKFLNVYKSK